jgi:hypothetical protein
MPGRVLVPLDRSRRAEAVLALLVDVCQPGDEVMLLSVSRPASRQQIGTRASRTMTQIADPIGAARLAPGREPPLFETPEQAQERRLAQLSRYLGVHADALQRKGYRVAIQALIARDTPGAIIEYATRYQPSAIVMVRRRLDPRRFFRSVSGRVRQSNVAPVLLLSSGHERKEPS